MKKIDFRPKAVWPALILLLLSCQGTPAESSPATSNSEEASPVATSEQPSEESSSIISLSEDTSEELSTIPEETSESFESQESESSFVSVESSSDVVYEVPDVSGTPWANLNFNQFGADFRDSLANLIKATGSKTCTYNELKDVLAKSDAFPGNSNYVVPFYHPITDKTNNWNREHVWPDSRGAGKSGPGSDPQMIRPTLSSDNSDRGNKFFGVAMSNTWDPASFSYPAARGEAARIVLYTATRYAKSHGFTLSNNPNDASSLKTMGVLKYMLQWNREYPVTEMEIRRNNCLDDLGFARNPFIDFPILADYIWNDDGLRLHPYGEDEGGGTVTPSNAYSLITSLEDISDGDKVVVVAEAADSAGAYASLSPVLYKDYYLTAETGQKENDKYYPNVSASEWTITFSDDCYVLSCAGKTLGVSINGTYKNLVAQAGLSTNHLWKPGTMGSDGKLSLKNVGTDTYMEYFKGDFTAYRTDNGVYLFRK